MNCGEINPVFLVLQEHDERLRKVFLKIRESDLKLNSADFTTLCLYILNKKYNKSSMSIDTGLNLKTRFVWEKKKRIKISESSSTFLQWSLKCRLIFFVQLIIFHVPLSVFMFTQVSMKELGRILILAHKIFSCRVSFTILLSMCLLIFEKKLWT